MNTLPTELIERALELTGKTMEDMYIPKFMGDAVVNGMVFPEFDSEFSIEKFCYHLLSDNFLRSYLKSNYRYSKASEDERVKFVILKDFSQAIYEYQKGNSEPLIQLLFKI